MTAKKRGPWSKECCTNCGAEGLASRGGPTINQGPYNCEDCVSWQMGYDEAIKNHNIVEKNTLNAEKEFKFLQGEVIRACTRLYLNDLPTAVRAYELLTHAMDMDLLKEECVPLKHPSRRKK